jgi:hypothetical protein
VGPTENVVSMNVNDLMPYVIIAGFLVNIFALITGMWKAISVLMAMHQSFNDLANKIGQKHPPEGLLGDVEEIKEAQKEMINKQAEADKTLAVVEANVAQRRTTDKKG